MKRLLLLCLCFLGLHVFVANAQNESYRALLKTYFGLSGNTIAQNFENSGESLAQITQMVMEESEEEQIKSMTKGARKAVSEKLVSVYMKTQFQEDVLDIFTPYYVENVTEEQLQVLVDKMSTERGRTSMEHISKMAVSQETIAKIVMELLGPLMEGKNAQPVKAVPCSETYAKNFQTYYENSGVDMILSQLQQVLLAANTNGNEKEQKTMQEFFTSLQANMPVITRNMMIEVVTEDDLQFWVELSSMPEYEGVKAVIKQMMSDPLSLGKSILLKYAEWLEVQTMYKL